MNDASNMNDITIYHNPHCRKSREALALAQQFADANKAPLKVVEYLKTPLGAKELADIRQRLDAPLRDMVRDTEEEFATLNLAQASDDVLLQALAEHPKLMQRPIVVYRGKAMIGRPLEKLHSLLRPD